MRPTHLSPSPTASRGLRLNDCENLLKPSLYYTPLIAVGLRLGAAHASHVTGSLERWRATVLKPWPRPSLQFYVRRGSHMHVLALQSVYTRKSLSRTDGGKGPRGFILSLWCMSRSLIRQYGSLLLSSRCCVNRFRPRFKTGGIP